MSDLQISLLAIGIVVVLAVYAFGAWQQRQYRRRFNTAFRQRGGDALYESAAWAEPHLPPAAAEPVEACSTLDAAIDYVAELSLPAPVSSGVLAPLLQRRFDFGKNVHVCGLDAATGDWQRMTADSRFSCAAFRLALQLADRNGMISEAQLGSFRDLVRETGRTIGAQAMLPEIPEAAEHARQLDAFCAEVDQMIGLNILPSGNHLLSGKEISRIAAQHKLVLEPDGAFHLLDAQGRTVFTMANFDNIPFPHDAIEDVEAIGLSLQMDVPRVDQPVQRFDAMLPLARDIGKKLRAAVVDDFREPLSDAGIAMIRAQVAAIEQRMQAYSITPGSAVARRLFS